jgi:hypothetical protein
MTASPRTAAALRFNAVVAVVTSKSKTFCTSSVELIFPVLEIDYTFYRSLRDQDGKLTQTFQVSKA